MSQHAEITEADALRLRLAEVDVPPLTEVLDVVERELAG